MSGQYNNKLAFIIPTRNRVECLSELMESMIPQKDLISQIIVVDGSDEPVGESFFDIYPFDVDYLYVNPPSLTRQKNEGIKRLNEDITIAGIFDDDIVFYEDTLEKLLDFWETCDDDLLGTSLNIVNTPPVGIIRKVLARIFYMDVKRRGKVLKSGFCSDLFPPEKNISVEWLCGGATVWRSGILQNNRYDESLAGWAYYEDAVFSYKLSKTGRLYVLKDARVDHNPPEFNIGKNLNLGRMLVINRYHFVRHHPELSAFFFFYSSLGEIIINMLQSFSKRDISGFLLAYGNILGIWDIIIKERNQIDESFRG